MLRMGSPVRDDDIGIPFGRFDELQVHGFHGLAVVGNGCVDVAAALGDIPQDDAHHAVVIVRIHENFDVHLVPQFLAGEDENAFYDDYIGRFHRYGFGLRAGTGEVGIDRLLDGFSLLEFADLLAKQFPVDGIRVIEVDFVALLHREVAGILIIGILGNDYYLLLEFRSNGIDHGGLA